MAGHFEILLTPVVAVRLASSAVRGNLVPLYFNEQFVVMEIVAFFDRSLLLPVPIRKKKG